MKKSAIIIMADTFQFNYLGCYGNDWIKTPNLDKFAKEGVLFENAYGEGMPTVPVRRAMMTGRYTLHDKGWLPLELDDTTITDLCAGQPVDTALIYDSAPLRLFKFGFARGFDKVWFLHGSESDQMFYAKDPLIHYKATDFHEEHVIASADAVLGEKLIGPLLHETEAFLCQRQYWKTDEDQNVARIMKKAVEYLEEVDRNKSFFLWVDSFDPHEPWDPPSVYNPDTKCPYDPYYQGKDQILPLMGPVEGVYTEEELHHIRMLYAEKCTMVDKWIGYLLDNIRRLGLDNDTLVIFVSDHGQPLGNGEHGHGIVRKSRPWPYEELVHIPFIMRGPGLPNGKKISSFVQSCDVAPTVTDYLGIGVKESMQGKSILPLAKGEVERVRDFAIAGYHRYSWSIITEDWSYIHWLRDDPKTTTEYHMENVVKPLREKFDTNSAESAAYKDYSRVASLDGEDQWTCTPGSEVEVPDRDELYDRRKDLFQLNNIIDKHPQKALELLQQLKEFMAELWTT